MATLEITLLFLGSIIGAGFATGAEIVTFFGDLRLPIWLIALIVGLAMFIIITLEILLHYNNRQPTKITTNKKITITCTKFLDIVFVMIYLTLFTTMTAGITRITNLYICIISLIISAYITLSDFHKLARFNAFIVLVIVVLIITTSLPHVFFTNKPALSYHFTDIPHAIFSAILYAGLNCFMFPELINASNRNSKHKAIFIAGIFTSIIITILVSLILFTIQSAGTQGAAVPLLAASPNIITTTIIFLAVLTSQYTALFAITQRTRIIIPQTNKKPLITTALICLCAFIGSFCGFNHIIQFAYPLIGAFTCFYLLFSFLMKFWQFLQHRHSR